ncbi:MAG: response regulator transcription factor [Myxococcota bacterium]
MGRALLVVDDDPDLNDLMTMILGEAGYQVVAATNGQEALAAVTRSMPALILLDMKMPVMGGAEFTQAFRERFDHLAPIVVVTAADDARRRAEEIGAEGWLGKPFNIGELLAKVQGYLR